MGAELGDMVAADGRVGEVVDLDLVTNRAVIRPFPRPGNEDWARSEPFVADGDASALTIRPFRPQTLQPANRPDFISPEGTAHGVRAKVAGR